MNDRRTGLPICQHITVGAQLQAIREQLLVEVATVEAAYPRASPVARRAHAALRAVDELRNALDAASANEHADGWAATVYYGANRARREADVATILGRHQAGDPACCTTPV
jgi:hypothetical protein